MSESGCNYPIRIMMIGPMPPPIGGTTVSFNLLQKFVSSHVSATIVIDTAKRNGSIVANATFTLFTLLRNLRRCDLVTMHFSDRAAVTIGPLIWILCKLARKPCAFRQFGGEFDRTFFKLNNFHRWIVTKTVMQSDVMFLQTRAMLEAFRPFTRRMQWFPTARKLQKSNKYKGNFSAQISKELKCLYVGHVSRAKGVEVAIHAVGQLNGVSFDIFGPLVDLAESDLNRTNARYCGILPPDRVTETMAEYDLLLFPTRHLGEGYSGTLVEAASVGLPIVASRWQSLPEMFSEDEVFFIKPADETELISTLKRIQTVPALLNRRSEKLKARANVFDQDKVFKAFLETCVDVAATKPNVICALEVVTKE